MKRSTLWVSLGLLAAFAGVVAASARQAGAPSAFQGLGDPAAQQRIADWIEALGGMERYWGVESARFTLTTEIYDAPSGRLRRTRPRYVTIARSAEGLRSRIERWEEDDFIEQGWSPAGQWARRNGSTLEAGDQDYDEADYVGGDVHYWFGLPYKLTDPGVNLHDDGRDEQGRQVVRVTFGEGVGDHQDVWRYYFQDGGSWPVQVDYIEAGKTAVNQTRWEDIRSADGYFYVGRRVHFDESGRVTKVIACGAVEINPAVPARLFEMP